MLHCIVLAVSSFCNPLTTSGEGVVQKATFANPIDLQYRMRPEEKCNFREGADPDVVMWDDRYWLFASKCGGYYVSDDLVSWRLVHTDDLPLEEYAPTAWVMDNRLYFSSRGGTVHRAVDADAGKWEQLKERVPFSADSKVFFEDGRLFDYYGGNTNKMPLWVSELDRSTFKPAGKGLPITEMDDTRYGWDVCGHDNGLMTRPGCKEGSYIINRNGVYYFQYATPGTEFFSYCDVALAGPTPLGPFKRQSLNPFSCKPNGYAKGAGHGCTFSDRHGNWWHVTTCVVRGINRRIVMFPVFFAADGEMWCDTAFADWPLVVPGHKTDNPDEYHTGWMPLTYGKRVSVSSAPGPSTKFIVDEDMHTSWIAASGNAGEWAEVDLGGPAEIRAVQIGFAENGNIDAWRRRDAARRWRLEVSNDGKSWECAIDESNASDSPDHPYRVLKAPVKATKMRVVCAGLPEGCKFALREIRAFGRMDVPVPSAVESFTVERDVADRRRARLSWSAAKGADGYIVRYGPAPDKLFLSVMFRDACEAEIRSLDAGQDYWWKIEAFNASGFSPSKLSDAMPKTNGTAMSSDGQMTDAPNGVHWAAANPPPATAKYRDASLPIEERIDDLLKWMTPCEKVKAIHSCGWMTSGGIKRIGLSEFRTIDGGCGPRAETRAGITYFPCGIAWAAAWDPDLAEEAGRATGEETRAVYVGEEGGSARMLFGPGGNIGGRTPFGARSFEYMGEDPLLAGRTAARFIRGLQSVKVSACMKHYACNDQEWCRTVLDVKVGQRALREIYAKPFEIAVREGGTWAIMNSYNAVNGTWTSWNRPLNDILYREIGWDGALYTDWGSYRDDLMAIAGGTTVEICWKRCGDGNPQIHIKELDDLKAGRIRQSDFDEQLRRALRLYFRVGAFDTASEEDQAEQSRCERAFRSEAHRDCAYRMAAESFVLLENRGGFLPVDGEKIRTVAVVGPNADQYHTMIDGGADLTARGGSGAVKAAREMTPLEGFCQVFGERNVLFAPGFRFENTNRANAVSVPALVAMDPVEAARKADFVVFCGGYSHAVDREVLGWGQPLPADRDYLTFQPGPCGESQEDLIRKIAAVNPNVVVAVTAGGPFTTEGFRDAVKGVIVTWYGGEFGGRVLADIVLGKINPSGKLPCTFGRKPEDWPSVALGKLSYPGVVTNVVDNKVVTDRDCTTIQEYKDGIWVGYRGFDHFGTKPLYPFGYGLSYTTFAIEPVGAKGGKFSVKVTNTGSRRGREVVQCYVTKPAVAGVEFAEKELADYASVELAPGESKIVVFTLTDEACRYWDERDGKWIVPSGAYHVQIGDSSDRVSATFTYNIDK